MIKKQNVLWSLLLIASLAFAEEARKPPETIRRMELGDYLGLWHEIARLPLFSQKNCIDSTAEYSLRSDGDLKIDNKCIKVKNGERHEVESVGRAWVIDEKSNSKLKVRFIWWLPFIADGDYWILKLDKKYQISLVGTPNYAHLWLLSRSATMPRKTFDDWMNYARSIGYNTDNLIISDGVQ